MKGQEFDICDLPFDGYYAPQVEIKRRRWGCPFGRHHGGRPGFGPYGGPGFDLGPEGHGFGPDHYKHGPPGDGHGRPGWARWGPPQREDVGVNFHGPPPGFGPGHAARLHGHGPSGHHFGPPPGFGPDHDGRPHNFHGHGPSGHHFGPPPWWFGRRGPSDAERPWTGPWGGPDQRP